MLSIPHLIVSHTLPSKGPLFLFLCSLLLVCFLHPALSCRQSSPDTPSHCFSFLLEEKHFAADPPSHHQVSRVPCVFFLTASLKGPPAMPAPHPAGVQESRSPGDLGLAAVGGITMSRL